MEQVLFCPKAQLIHNPIATVFRGKKNVVDVDNHTWVQPRQNLEEKVVNISADPDRVRTVDEKDVIGLQSGEETVLNLLNLFDD